MERTLPSKHLSRPPTLPASFLLKMALPLVLPVALTVFISITVGETWPRSIAPGSGLRASGSSPNRSRSEAERTSTGLGCVKGLVASSLADGLNLQEAVIRRALHERWFVGLRRPLPPRLQA